MINSIHHLTTSLLSGIGELDIRKLSVIRPLLRYLATDILHNKDIRTPNFRSFAFMTEDLILAGIVTARIDPALRVLSIAACVNPIRSLDDMPYICELQYPKSSGSTDYFLIRSEPTPSWRPPPGSGAPFYCSRKDFIFTISVRYSSDQIQEGTVLFVPLSTLLLEAERSRHVPRRDVAWKDWGPSGARMVCKEPSETWVCYNYGMKFVHGLQWDGRQVARIYDFNPYAAKKHVKSTIDPSISWKLLVAASEPSSRCEIFEEDVVTTLPGRVTNFKLGSSCRAVGAGWEAVMIGEDHILMVQVRTPIRIILITPTQLISSFFVSVRQSVSNQYGYMAM